MTKRQFDIRAERVGVLPTPGWALVSGDNDSTLHDLAFYIWVVRDGDTIGLVDSGLPSDAVELQALSDTNKAFGDEVGFRSVRSLPDVLSDAGIAPGDVSFVAITQTVSYHTGGIDADLLPNAHFYIAFEGLEELVRGAPGHPAPEFYFPPLAWASLRTLAVDGRLHLIDTECEIVPGVRFEVTGGHHPGSAAVLIETREGLVGILETAFVNRNLETRRPIGNAEDMAAARRAIVSFLERCDRVVAIHDPANQHDFGGDR